jgi:tetratricopeptide (TPR) repeat protein
MNNIRPLRSVIVGLFGFAAAEEEMLLTADIEGPSGPDRWAAVPLVAHTTEFKLQQLERISAARSGQSPPAYAEIDHSSTAIYSAYAARSAVDGVRALSGFWHPIGHVADYYLQHEQPGRAVELQEQALATTRYLGAPDQAVGMAAYSLASAQAQAGMIDEAAKTLTEAITLNPDVRANASRDADLAKLRDNGQLTAMLAA